MGDKKDVTDAAKDFQDKEKGGADSSKQFAAAGHQARNDMQDAGEDVGSRDRSSKADVPSKEESQSSEAESGASESETSEKK